MLPDMFYENLTFLDDATTLIAGEWRASLSGKVFQVKNPVNQDIIASVPDCDISDASLVVDSAIAGFEIWKKKTAKERSQILYRWYELVIEHQATLAKVLTTEQGKPLQEAKAEVAYGASYIQWFAEEAKRIDGSIIPAQKSSQKILVTKEPVGICVSVTPWNFPIAMITRKVAAALAAGCSVIVKPAEETPLSAIAISRLAEEAGIPEGVINILTTSQPAEVVKYLCEHPSVKKISFTGSTEVGKLLMKQSASTLKKITLELGGNAPFIVCDDADLDAAVDGAMASKFRNTGQTCVCTNRFLVHESVAEKFTQKLQREIEQLKVGAGMENGVQQGPLINEQAIKKVERHIADAVEKGGRLMTGGQRHSLGGTFFEPTLISNGSADMQINLEETFGPVALIIPFSTLDEAIQIANNTQYGLAAYAFTQNLSKAMQLADQLEYGMVGINEGIISNEMAPFGGVKESGMGREGSKFGLDDYLQLKYTLLGGL